MLSDVHCDGRYAQPIIIHTGFVTDATVHSFHTASDSRSKFIVKWLETAQKFALKVDGDERYLCAANCNSQSTFSTG